MYPENLAHRSKMELKDFSVWQINDDSDSNVIKILKFGLDIETDDSYYLANYHPNHANQSRNLFDLLKRGKFKNGGYYVVTAGDSYVASGGWYFYQEVIIGLSRANIADKYKSLPVLGDIILPKILETADFLQKKVWLTFNEENKIAYEGFKRAQEGKAPILGQAWPATFRKFSPIGLKMINNFLQYVVEYDPRKLSGLNGFIWNKNK